MLRQRSSEVMDRTQSRTGHALDPTRPPYALHVGLTRRLPDNWLSSQFVIFACARQRGFGRLAKIAL